MRPCVCVYLGTPCACISLHVLPSTSKQEWDCVQACWDSFLRKCSQAGRHVISLGMSAGPWVETHTCPLLQSLSRKIHCFYKWRQPFSSFYMIDSRQGLRGMVSLAAPVSQAVEGREDSNSRLPVASPLSPMYTVYSLVSPQLRGKPSRRLCTACCLLSLKAHLS